MRRYLCRTTPRFPDRQTPRPAGWTIHRLAGRTMPRNLRASFRRSTPSLSLSPPGRRGLCDPAYRSMTCWPIGPVHPQPFTRTGPTFAKRELDCPVQAATRPQARSPNRPFLRRRRLLLPACRRRCVLLPACRRGTVPIFVAWMPQNWDCPLRARSTSRGRPAAAACRPRPLSRPQRIPAPRPRPNGPPSKRRPCRSASPVRRPRRPGDPCCKSTPWLGPALPAASPAARPHPLTNWRPDWPRSSPRAASCWASEAAKPARGSPRCS